jgi:hypothetical protein
MGTYRLKQAYKINIHGIEATPALTLKFCAAEVF